MKITPYKFPTNFSQVDDILYRSAQPNEFEIDYMKKEIGLTDIFNVSDNSPVEATKKEITTAKSLGIKYHAIPTRTDNPIWENIKQFVDKVNSLKTVNRAKVLLHCNAGVDRTGTYTLFYQLINKLKSYTEAVQEMIAKGHIPKDIPKLLPKIEEYAKKAKLI